MRDRRRRRSLPTAVLVYDGDCGFCTRAVRAMGPLRLAEPRIVAHQHADLASLGLTVEQCQRELQWVGPAGRIDSGAQAVASLLRASGGPWSVVGALLRVPPARWVAALVYRLVASNRQRLPGGTGTCALPLGAAPVSADADPAPPGGTHVGADARPHSGTGT